eukprot:CAMPEP_0177770566 /NCGR_PEP_ID=MMETSP0491_2-20121128/11011_1 /TAXON_ID=63592 /ORGANISM="Tetraselmis chuii, Strain PLY429" /LENGTH=213 /DNA_ID=CAMNT_0019287825 /DNA_START=115 /DNA_END=757 /DNA_ORIENTATION=-
MVFLSLTRPSALQVDEAVSHGSRQGFNYRHVGKTEGAPPLDDELVRERWTVDHTRVQVGKGRAAYEEGKRALKSWQHFQLGWTTVDASTRVEKGSKVCVVARAVLPWTRNPLEIVYAKEGSRKVPASDGKGGTNAKVFSFAHEGGTCWRERSASRWSGERMTTQFGTDIHILQTRACSVAGDVSGGSAAAEEIRVGLHGSYAAHAQPSILGGH